MDCVKSGVSYCRVGVDSFHERRYLSIYSTTTSTPSRPSGRPNIAHPHHFHFHDYTYLHIATHRYSSPLPTFPSTAQVTTQTHLLPCTPPSPRLHVHWHRKTFSRMLPPHHRGPHGR